MDSDLGMDFGRQFSPLLLYPITVILILIFLFGLSRAPRGIVRFAMFIPWLRYMLSVHHAITFQVAAAGLSWNALASSSIFAAGVALVKRRNFLLKPLLPFYLIMSIYLVSGLVNRDLSGTIDIIIKFGYLVIITICVYEALGRNGEARVMGALLWAFSAPIILQILSVVFGISKATEADGSVSYIGGYHHEAAFSIVLTTCFVVTCLASGLKRWLRTSLLLICLAGIVLANYRTTILAIAPIAIMQFNADFISKFSPRHRAIILFFLTVFSAFAVGVAAFLLRERFADLVTVISDPGRVIKPPMEYSSLDQKLLSGRPFLWSLYIDGFIHGTTAKHLIGFGPNSWEAVFPIYAHNTLVSTLYELGYTGVAAMIYLWTSMALMVVRAKHGQRGKALAAHMTFFLVNMATMGHWMIEGDIMYGIICGYSLHIYLRPATFQPGVRVAAKASNVRPLRPEEPESATLSRPTLRR